MTKKSTTLLSKLLIYIPFIWNYILLKKGNSEFVDPPKISGFLKLLGRKGKLLFGNNVTINSSAWANPVGNATSSFISLGPGSVIKIGNCVGISNSLLAAKRSITIEDDVLIGGGCQILDNDFHSLDYHLRSTEEDQNNVTSAPIIIKKGAFIGTNSIILKGVTIGEQSIIAAGSVVTKSIPSHEMWGGNPVKFIRKIEIK